MSGDLRIKCEMMNGDLRRIRIYTNGDLRYNLDFFFLQLQQLTGVRLYEKESVIILMRFNYCRKQDRQSSILWQMEDINTLKQGHFYR